MVNNRHVIRALRKGKLRNRIVHLRASRGGRFVLVNAKTGVVTKSDLGRTPDAEMDVGQGRGTRSQARLTARHVASPTSPAKGIASTKVQENAGLSAALRAVVEGLPPDEVGEFIEAITAPSTDTELDPTLWGPQPSTSEITRAQLTNLANKYQERQAVLNQSITRSQAAQLLGVTDQAVSDRLVGGDLVGLKEGRVWKLPAWQFNADTENGWLPGIAELRKHFPAGPVTLTAWATTPNADLDGQTPATRLTAGAIDDVLLIAQAIGPAAW